MSVRWRETKHPPGPEKRGSVRSGRGTGVAAEAAGDDVGGEVENGLLGLGGEVHNGDIWYSGEGERRRDEVEEYCRFLYFVSSSLCLFVSGFKIKFISDLSFESFFGALTQSDYPPFYSPRFPLLGKAVRASVDN